MATPLALSNPWRSLAQRASNVMIRAASPVPVFSPCPTNLGRHLTPWVECQLPEISIGTLMESQISGTSFQSKTLVISRPELFQVAMTHIWAHLFPGRSLSVKHIASINSNVIHFALFICMGWLNICRLQHLILPVPRQVTICETYSFQKQQGHPLCPVNLYGLAQYLLSLVLAPTLLHAIKTSMGSKLSS